MAVCMRMTINTKTSSKKIRRMTSLVGMKTDYAIINFHNGPNAIPCTLTLELDYAFLDHYNLIPNNASMKPTK